MEGSEQGSPGYNVDLTSKDEREEITLVLTLGQLKLINKLLGDMLQPRGYDMIAWSFDLFERLKDAINSVYPEEAFMPAPNEGSE